MPRDGLYLKAAAPLPQIEAQRVELSNPRRLEEGVPVLGGVLHAGLPGVTKFPVLGHLERRHPRAWPGVLGERRAVDLCPDCPCAQLGCCWGLEGAWLSLFRVHQKKLLEGGAKADHCC